MQNLEQGCMKTIKKRLTCALPYVGGGSFCLQQVQPRHCCDPLSPNAGGLSIEQHATISHENNEGADNNRKQRLRRNPCFDACPAQTPVRSNNEPANLTSNDPTTA